MNPIRAWLTVLIAVLALVPNLHGQEPPPLDFTVTPPDQAILITETTNRITVTLGSPGSFTNVTVTGDIDGDPLNFAGTTNYSANYVAPFVPPPAGITVQLNVTVIATDIASVTNEPPVDPPVVVTNTATLTYIIVPRPPNDNFTNAFKIPNEGALILGTNTYASLQAGEPRHAGLATADTSVWWNWSAPDKTNVLIDLAGSDWPAVLAVYRGDSISNLVLVGSSTNDVANQLPPNVAFQAVKGATYRIAVSGLTTNSYGNLRLRVAVGATPDKRPPSVSILNPEPDTLVTGDAVVISGTAREAGVLDAGVSNVVVRVNGGAFTNAVGAEGWAVPLRLPPGTNVIQAVAIDYAGNQSQPDTIVVRYVNPTNDLFALRAPLPGVAGSVNAINGRATREPGEPVHAGNEGGRSVWYSWRAPTDGQFQLTTAGSSFDTLLATYTGAVLDTLAPVAANDDAAGDFTSAVNFPVVSNQVYQVAVDGFGAETGDIILNYVFTPRQPTRFYTVTVPSSPGGSVTPPGGSFAEGSLATLAAIPDPDYVFERWTGDYEGTANPLQFAVTGNATVRPVFQLVAATDDFETGNLTRLPWQSTGTNAWRATEQDAAGGTYSARSGPTANGTTSLLTLVTNTAAGAVSFSLRVSSEPTWDFLEFVVNGTPRRRWSGEVPWERFAVNVDAGTNRLEWRYVKDANFSAGLDAAFIDDVYVPPATSSVPAPTLDLTTLTPPTVTITGEPGRTQVIEASGDLSVWSVLAVEAAPDGVVTAVDTGAPVGGNRYYRGRTQ